MNVMRQAFYSMVVYASYLIYIFMNINGNIRSYSKITEKLRGIPTKLLISQLFIALEKHTWYNIKSQHIWLDYVPSLEVLD